MSSPALSCLLQELKQVFAVLRASKAQWDSALSGCEPLLSSLGNLAVQMKALAGLQLSNTPLASFPDLYDRLQFKLALAVDAALGTLAEKLDALQRARDAIAQQVSAVLQLYESSSDALDLVSCVSRSAVCPSVSDMLEWLQDAERHYRLQLAQRRALLQMLTPSDLSLMETAPKRWAALHSASGEERIADALCQVSFFMETE